MLNIIGNKDSIGIEYKINTISPYLMGCVRLWLGGRYVGAIDDEDMLLTTLFYLDGFNFKEVGEGLFSGKLPDEIYDLIESGSVSDAYGYVFSRATI